MAGNGSEWLRCQARASLPLGPASSKLAPSIDRRREGAKRIALNTDVIGPEKNTVCRRVRESKPRQFTGSGSEGVNISQVEGSVCLSIDVEG